MVTPTLQALSKTQTAVAQQTATVARQTVQAEQGQLENVVTDQKVAGQQMVALEQTAAAAKQTVAAQESQIQALAVNQTAAATQLAAVQQTAVAAQQSLTGLQTTVANLLTTQQTAAAPKASAAPTEIVSTPRSASTPQPTATSLLYAWYFKRPVEPPQLCGPGQGNPCVDSAPNQGTQYISGHVIDQHGKPAAGITVQAKSGATVLFNSTDTTGYYSILLYTACPSLAQSWDVYIVDTKDQQSSYVKTITYTNCAQAGEFHVDFVEAPHS